MGKPKEKWTDCEDLQNVIYEILGECEWEDRRLETVYNLEFMQSLIKAGNTVDWEKLKKEEGDVPF